MEDGFIAAKTLFRRTKPSAIFCYSDFVAFGVMRAIREKGWRIPTDIAVIGYDDVESATCLEPSLSTVRIPKEKLGAAALELLVGRLKGEVSEETSLTLEIELVARQSTLGNEGGEKRA